MKNKLFLLSTLILIGACQTFSQTETHKKAAEELLTASGAENNFKISMEKMMDLQSKSNPAMAQYADIIKQWAGKYLTWATLKDDMMKLYTDEFTEKELKELTKFYKSPIGLKLASKQGEIMSKGAEIGQKKALEHTPELQQMIMDKMNEKKE